MTIFLIRPKPSHWGDYGKILVHGMSAHLPRRNGLIRLERSGPFLPPLTVPRVAEVVVSDAMRKEISASGLRGATFRPVEKAKVVHIEWERWDRSAKMPPELPPSGEPEDYILARPPNDAVAAQLGDLWELDALECGTGKRELLSRFPRRYRTVVALPSEVPSDFFRVPGPQGIFVSETAKLWLDARAGDWVTFEDVEVTSGKA